MSVSPSCVLPPVNLFSRINNCVKTFFIRPRRRLRPAQRIETFFFSIVETIGLNFRRNYERFHAWTEQSHTLCDAPSRLPSVPSLYFKYDNIIIIMIIGVVINETMPPQRALVHHNIYIIRNGIVCMYKRYRIILSRLPIWM